MIKSYKFRIYPNKQQINQINNTFGCCRWVYNWALAYKTSRYQQFKQNVSRFELSKMLTFFKTTEERNWLSKVNSQSLISELIHLESAFTKFFNKNGKYPRFKKKNNKQSCEYEQGIRVEFKNKKVKIPKFGLIKYRDNRVFTGKIKTCTVTRNCVNQYFISIMVDDGKELPGKKEIVESKSIGIDVGIRNFITVSDGTKINNPKYLDKQIKRLKYYHKQLSKKKLGGKNWIKKKLIVAKLHQKVSNSRHDFIHKITSNIIKNHDTIFVEDLNIEGMKKGNWARQVSDIAWGELFRQLTYKSDWYGNNLIKIGRFEPSSKMCGCGVINRSLKLSDSEWKCQSCHTINDRDLLAARNIKNFGLMKLNYNTAQGMGIVPTEESCKRSVEVGIPKQ
jgi:putative transposase